MKKLLAVVLAAATVASLGVTSFAANVTTDTYFSFSATEGDDISAVFDDGKSAIVTGKDTVLPDQTIYFRLPDLKIDGITSTLPPTDWTDATDVANAVITWSVTAGAAADGTFASSMLNDKDEFKVKFDKGSSNPKMIKSMSLSEDNVKGVGRGPWLKVSLKDDWTDSEYKIAPSVTFTTKKSYVLGTSPNEVAIPAGTKFQINFDKYYINNTTETADQDYAAGKGGVMLKPQKNEDNEIIWHDENRDLARLTFVGDSNVNKVFPKLSTKWENEDYAELFADQNAFYFDFVANVAGKTTISSTSRATLEIYNPYYDKDEDTLLVDPADVVIYEVAEDGTFEDVTASFTAGENDDGDSVFVTKTRELGTYIFAEKTAGVVEEVVEAPAKDVPNTGR